MDLGNMNGQTVPAMKVNGKKMRLLDMGIINGLMEGNMLVIGKVTSWMNSDYTLGKMDVCTKDFTRMTRNMVTAFTPGLTLRNTQDGGIMESNMALEYSSQKKEKRNLVFGKMALNLNGSVRMKQNL